MPPVVYRRAICYVSGGHMRRRAHLRYDRKKKKKESKLSAANRMAIEAAVYVAEIALVVLLAFGIVHYGFAKASMVGDSMTQTHKNGDSLLINKFVYKISEPKRLDVIAYRIGSSEYGYINIKRIIGVPGERIRITDGEIYINGEKLIENVNVEKMTTAGLAEDEIVLDENEYFVLGDNRNNSEDSRFASVGMIIKNDIVGKVWIRLNSFGFVSSFNRTDNTDTDNTDSEV